MDKSKYPKVMQAFHWLTASGVFVCVATVKMAQSITKNNPTVLSQTKGDLMTIHKSTALIVTALMIPRLFFRFKSAFPQLPPGNSVLKIGAKLGHFGLYSLLILLPISGICMGYFGGKGLPFFSYTIPGSSIPNSQIASGAFKAHSFFGKALTFLIPIHIGAVGFHSLKGQHIFLRMIP